MSETNSKTDSKMEENENSVKTAAEKLYCVCKKLRAPDGCPWDKKQTPQTMKGPVTEELYEVLDAIDENEPLHIKEELGDLLFNIFMIAGMEEEAGNFTISEMIEGVREKIVRRHPHVFGSQNAENSPERALELFYSAKEKEKGRKKEFILDEVPKNTSALLRASGFIKKAASKGFDWENIDGALKKLNEETAEFMEAVSTGDKDKMEDEGGDLLFAAVNLLRMQKINPETALARANKKFYNRYKFVENSMNEKKIDFDSPDALSQMEKFWKEAKSAEKDT